MSIASDYGVENNYLDKLQRLEAEIKPLWISDHLCFTRSQNHNSHDLLPVVFNKDTLELCKNNIDRVQQSLGHEIAIENISTYLEFKENTMKEWEFLARLQQESSCKILLDLNNICVNAHNHGFSADDYLKSLDKDSIIQFHLAGHVEENGLKIDTHSEEVSEDTFDLLGKAIKLFGPVSPLLEWDANIPDIDIINKHISKIEDIYKEAGYNAN